MIRPNGLAPGVALSLATVLLSGCLQGGADPQPPYPSMVEGPSTSSAEATPVTTLASRPHVHDYWGGETELQLMQGRVAILLWHNHLLDEPPREQHTHGCDETMASPSQGGSIKFVLPEDQLVLPGTAELLVTASWQDPAILGLRLLYRPTGQHDFIDGGVTASGQTLRLPVTDRMADAGHSPRSQWAFFLCAAGEGPLQTAQGEAQVSIVARRVPGPLPLEPAHPDRWAGRADVLLANQTWSGTALAALNKGQDAWLRLELAPGVVVPPGTTQARVSAEVRRDVSLGEVDRGDLLVYYRDASVPEWAYKLVAAESVEEGRFQFQWTVEGAMADGIYADESNWEFWLRIVSQTTHRPPGGVGTWSAPYAFQGSVEASVTAIRAGADAAA